MAELYLHSPMRVSLCHVSRGFSCTLELDVLCFPQLIDLQEGTYPSVEGD
jgi:hypothetical protein